MDQANNQDYNEDEDGGPHIKRLKLRQTGVLDAIKKKDEIEKLIAAESELDANIKVLFKELDLYKKELNENKENEANTNIT
ncbi:unnamed protein product [Adineta steineri]|uniref:Uncharacterized protein n=1 Tax=Adineta steineri TaxID=433720 RepID=A0A813M157_9BILA|nr:unnamed protein product [Adineta steineri]CAF1349639.1 unnamed protein product [Adineta steineri]CAF3672219.1 unnamed protein product [Adineta steineri]CAF4177450.1 unnamed protein product [Adineta steineri]